MLLLNIKITAVNQSFAIVYAFSCIGLKIIQFILLAEVFKRSCNSAYEQ